MTDRVTHLSGFQLLPPASRWYAPFRADLNSELHPGWKLTLRGTQLGQLIVPHKLEPQHILITGSTGAGKTVLERSIVRQIQQRQEHAIIVDPEGDFISEFFDPQRGDVVLNPADDRCPFYDLWGEIRPGHEDIDVPALAESLLRKRPLENKQFFLDSARTIMTALLQRCNSIEALQRVVQRSSGEIHRMLQGTDAYPLISAGAQAQSSAVMGEVTNALKHLRVLPRRNQAIGTWSAREWVRAPRGWLFLSRNSESHAASIFVQGLWLDALTRWLMNIEYSGHVWIIIDELATLGRLPMVEQLAFRGRKRGLCLVMAFQAVSQIRELYGRDGAMSLIGQPSTKVILRCDEPDLAEWASTLLGNHRIVREYVTKSNKGQSQSDHYLSERLVTKDEIGLLPELQAYVAIASHNRTRINIPRDFAPEHPKHPKFIPRKHKLILNLEEAPAEITPELFAKAPHGHARRSGKSLTYKRYQSALTRCTNPNHADAKYYNRRRRCLSCGELFPGATKPEDATPPCDRCGEDNSVSDPVLFLYQDVEDLIADIGTVEDAAKRNNWPAANITLERKDREGPYGHTNCAWILQEDQAKNRRRPARRTAA